MRREETKARSAAQGGNVFPTQRTNLATVSLNLRLTTPYLSSHSAIMTASTLSGPAAPDNFRATFSTTDAVTLTSIKAGILEKAWSASACG
eukprot:9997966-Ditylum_brightwellii.AAC.1